VSTFSVLNAEKNAKSTPVWLAIIDRSKTGIKEKNRNLKKEKHLRYKKPTETNMWKVILLVLAIVGLLLEPERKLRKTKKREQRKKKSDYFNPSGPVPPMGLGL